MPAEETGIVVENAYADPRLWNERSREFFYGSVGSGVAIGDFDNDGRPDLVFVSKTEGHRLFRNLGNWRFRDVTAEAGLAIAEPRAWEQGVTWVDVNNDGRLDLYICRSGAPNLLYINQGDGRFHEEAAARGLALNDDSVMAAFADYDRDGALDVLIVTNLQSTGDDVGRPDKLFHNRGDGTFVDVSASAGIGQHPYQGHAALWWDYDNDGWPDLYIANDFSAPDQFFHNNRDGTFTDDGGVAVPHTPYSSMGADVGDLNNDGWIDLLATDMAPTTHEGDQRTMAEVRAKLNPPSLDPTAVVQIPRNALFLNTGTGFCLEAAELAGLARTDWTWSVRCEDLDCDGWLDVHVTNGMNREHTNVDLMRRIDAAANTQEQIAIRRASPVLAERHLAFRNRGDLTFEEVSEAWGLGEIGVSFGAAFGDLDGDGDLDLVYVNYQRNVTVLRNDAPSGQRLLLDLRGTASNRFGIGAVVRLETTRGVQVRPLVLARGYMSSSEPVLHFGIADGDHIERAVIQWPSGREQRLEQLAPNQRYTIVEPTAAASAPERTPASPPQLVEISRFAGLEHLAREDAFDEFSRQPLLTRSSNAGGPALAVGDLSGDGRDDIVIGGTTLTPAQVLVADGEGGYRASAALTGFARPRVDDGPVLVFDADGDGRNDVLLTSGGTTLPSGDPARQPRLALNRGSGNFAAAPAEALPPLPAVIGAAALADFDRDGKLDVFLGARVEPGHYPEAGASGLLRNTGGRFTDVTDILAPALRTAGLVNSALWSDVDGDGWPDLLLAIEWGGIRCLHNRNGQGFDDWTEKLGFAAAGTGMWSVLATADFNGDGVPDFAAGNLGLNTPYRASPAEPMLLFRGVFEDGADPVSVEAYFEKGRILPRVPRGVLSAAIPSVGRRLARTNDYARATLPEIFGPARLAAARRYAVTELRSGIFLSQPGGGYRFIPLPRLAQVAPYAGLAAGDFDGDGMADILALQNSHAFNRTVGRFDGGLGQLLRGDGTGHFTAVPARESGLLVPGEARALVLINFDNDPWPDFFLTRSRSPSLAYQNRGRPNGQTLQVRLRGQAGNPTAIGARVTVESTDGRRQTAEVTGGGGLFSQSTAALYFGNPDATARAVAVRWPNGQVSRHPLTGTKPVIEIDEATTPRK